MNMNIMILDFGGSAERSYKFCGGGLYGKNNVGEIL